MTIRQYSLLTLNFDNLAHRVRQLTATTRVAFTQWFAANQIQGRWLALRLMREGYSVWCDLERLRVGDDFWREIENVIR